MSRFCLLIKFLYYLQNFFILILQKILFKQANYDTCKKILIFRTGSFGDSLCAIPAIHTIKQNFPKAQVDILTNTGKGKNLVSLASLLNLKQYGEVIDYNAISKKELFEQLKHKQYDMFIELSQDQATLRRIVRNMLVVKLLRIPYAFGWQVSAINIFTGFQYSCIEFEQETIRLLKNLQKNGLKEVEITYPLNITPNDEDYVQALLQQKNLDVRDKNIALVVGANRLQNRWPIQNFEKVVTFLIEKGYNILCVGGKEDTQLVKQLPKKSVYNFCGQLTPLQSAVLMRNTRLTIANDTGPMHLSYVMKTPVIAIFSARDYPKKWFPLDSNEIENTVLRDNNIPCMHCFTETCKTQECMLSITPEQVIRNLRKYNI